VQLLWRDLRLALIGIGVAGDQGQALGAGVEVEALEHGPDAVLRDSDPAPFLPGEFGGDAPGPESWVPQGEGEHPVLEVGADLVGHPWLAPLPDPQPVKAVALQLRLPGVVGGSGHPHRPAGLRDVAELLGQGEQAQPESEQHVILSHRILLAP